MSTSFDPLNMFSWFRAPLSGDVTQRIATSWLSPSLTFNFAGDAALEEKIVSNVASYGRQIGWLSEIVSALADGKPVPADAVVKLKDAMAAISALKAQTNVDAGDAAKLALDKLERSDPDGFKKLISDRARSLKTDAPA